LNEPRLEFLDASQLCDNPQNWKFHPAEQVEALSELIGELGWLKPLVLNERTGKLLDGHGRKPIAVAGGKPVPVFIVDLAPELEAKALATLDPIGWTATADKRRYDALLKGASLLKSTTSNVKKLLESVSKASTVLDDQAGDGPRKPDEESEITVPLDSIWPSSNPWDVPDLLLGMQAESVPMPVWTWGTIGHKRSMPGTWHFYTDDSKFESLWRRPNRVLASGCAAVCEPNYSTGGTTPNAQALWSVFRRRWIGRYLQQCGVRLFCDLNVDARFNRVGDDGGDCPLNLLGVPRGWRAYSSRAHANAPDALLDEWAVAQAWSGVESPLFLVVGGGKLVKSMAKEKGWVWVPEQMQLAHPSPSETDA
jgi:Domain of unknown function (DUF4417)